MTTYSFVYGATERDLETYYGLQITGMTGLGAPPAENIVTPYAVSDGAYYQRTVYRPRVITLVGFFQPTSLADLHSKRKLLWGDINRDARASATFLFKYYGANASTPLTIPVRYNGGLEGELDAERGNHQPFALSLLAVQPFWSGGTSVVTTGAIGTAGCTLALTNAGDANAYPVIDILVNGLSLLVTTLSNDGADAKLLFNWTVSSGQALTGTIDCTPGARSIKLTPGNTSEMHELLAGSDLQSFSVPPGAHNLRLYSSVTAGAGTATLRVTFSPAYSSVDGAAV